MPEQVSPGE